MYAFYFVLRFSFRNRAEAGKSSQGSKASVNVHIAQFLFAYTATYSLRLAWRMDKRSEGEGMNCEVGKGYGRGLWEKRSCEVNEEAGG